MNDSFSQRLVMSFIAISIEILSINILILFLQY